MHGRGRGDTRTATQSFVRAGNRHVLTRNATLPGQFN
jgi:hypothetical protein